jgi:hypothetical protein
MLAWSKRIGSVVDLSGRLLIVTAEAPTLTFGMVTEARFKIASMTAAVHQVAD